MRNEPNFHPGHLNYAKQTQFQYTRCPAARHLCETNPIPAGKSATSPCGGPKNAKRTQFPPSSCLMPIASCPNYAKQTQFHPRLSSRAAGCGAKRRGPKPRDLFKQHRRRRFRTNKPRPYPHYAKQTQFAPPLPSPRPKNAKRTQFPPSSCLMPIASCPNYAKQTQFHPRLSSRAAGCGAKRRGPKPRDLFKQHRRRRFRTNKPRPYPHYAKRTQSQPVDTPNLQSTIDNIQSHGPISTDRNGR